MDAGVSLLKGFTAGFAAASVMAGAVLLAAHDIFQTRINEIQVCPVPPESTMVCGYVERDRPNHAGLKLRATGCGPYDGR